MIPHRCTELNLFGQRISDVDAATLAVAFSSSPALRTLDLTKNDIGPAGVEALARGLLGSRIQRLILSSNPLGDDGAVAFFNVFDQTSAKRSVMRGFAEPSGLEELVLHNCEIGASGANAIARALEPGGRLGSLKRLLMANNGFGNDGAVALGASLARGGSPKLATLSLSANGIGDVGAAELARALERRGGGAFGAVLEELGLSDNAIGDVGAEALAVGLSARPQALGRLYLSRNRVGVAGVTALLGALKTTALTVLGLHGNPGASEQTLRLIDKLTFY